MKSSISPLWTDAFIKICFVNLFVFINFHALLPTFPFFIEHLGGDSIAVGCATALFSVASIFLRPYVGWLIDTRGRRIILFISMGAMCFISVGYIVSFTILLAILLRTLHGACFAAASDASSTLVTDIIPKSRMGEGMGIYGLSMAISTAAAPAIGLSMMHMGYPHLFVTAALSCVMGIVILWIIKGNYYTPKAVPLTLKGLVEPISIPASITQFFYMVAYAAVEVFVAIYASQCGLLSGGVYFVGIALATVLTRVLFGGAVDKYGEAPMVYSGNAALLVGIALLVLCHNTPCYLLSALLVGYSFGATQPSLLTMAVHAVKPERRGAATSTFFVAFDLSIVVAGALAGVLIKFLGYDAMFLLMALFCVVSVGYYYLVARKHVSALHAHKLK